MTRTYSNRLTAAVMAVVLVLSTWLPTLAVPADVQFAATSPTVELA